MQAGRQAGRQAGMCTLGSHAWIILLGVQLDLTLNVPVRSHGEDKSESMRGWRRDLLA